MESIGFDSLRDCQKGQYVDRYMEFWKDSPSLPEYFMVSNLGRVWSKRTGRIIKPSKSNGYNYISTRVGGRSGKCVAKKISREVASAFIANTHNKPYVNHISGDKSDDCVENLEWVTASENNIHAIKNGLSSIPDNTLRRKLSQEQVSYVLSFCKPRDRLNGFRALSRMFGVDKCLISKIYYNNGYKD